MGKRIRCFFTWFTVCLFGFSCVFQFQEAARGFSEQYTEGLLRTPSSVAAPGRTDRKDSGYRWRAGDKVCLLTEFISEDNLGMAGGAARLVRVLRGDSEGFSRSRIASAIVCQLFLLILFLCFICILIRFDVRRIQLWRVIQYIHLVDGKKGIAVFAVSLFRRRSFCFNL